MGRDDRGDERDRTTPEHDRPERETTRRGVLRRAGAVGALPVAGLTGRGTAGPGETSDSGVVAGRQTAPTEEPPPVAFVRSLDLATEFDCLADARDTVARAVAQTADGGYVVLGSAHVPGDSVSWVLRTDPRGRPRSVGRYDLWLNDFLVEDDGGLVLLGSTSDRYPSNDCRLVSVDRNGDTRWVCEYDHPEGDNAFGCHSLVRTASGGYAWISTWPAVYVVDERGERLWKRSYTPPAGIDNAYPRTLVQLRDGGFVFAGPAQQSGTLGKYAPAWVVRTDADGDCINQILYSAESSGRWNVNDAVTTSDGNVAIAGGTEFYPDYQYLMEPGSFFLLTVQPTLDVVSYETYYPEGCDFSHANVLVEAPDGGFVLAGDGGACETEDRYRFVLRVVRLAPDGTVRWTYTWPHDLSETSLRNIWPGDMLQTADEGIAVVVNDPDADGFWLLKLGGESPS